MMKESRELARNPDAAAGRSAGGTGDPFSDSVECRKWLRFERLLTDLSSRFCALTPEEVDGEIEASLRSVCEELGLDLSAVWQSDAGEPDTLLLTHLYRALEGPPKPEYMRATESFPWVANRLLSRETVVIASMDDLPPEAGRDREVFRHFGVRTAVAFPLAVGEDRPFGAVSFNDVRADRQWEKPLIERLRLVAQIFANAIVRKQHDLALRLSESRLKLAADSAGAGLWSLDVSSRRFWLTDRTRRLFDFGIDEIVTFERFAETLHPDDRDRLYETLDRAVRTGQDVQVEYRIIDPAGNVRWMASQGRLQGKSPEDGNVTLMGATLDVTERKVTEARLREALAEVESLRHRLQQENRYLQKQIRSETGGGRIVGESELVGAMLETAASVAPTDAAVLIGGETGTGKELLAQYIHDRSARRGRPLVKVNCAALPAPLVESELFGREKGAYTGAMTRQVGRFEIADGSTILLDEIGDLPLELQAKLLRVLEDGSFERLGSSQVLHTDARIIAATNRDLDAMVASGDFREDLYHRLNVFPIAVPPLRERSDDIPLLVWTFVEHFNGKMGRSVESVPQETMRRLRQLPWPGNVRELRNVIERAMILSTGRVLNLDLPKVAGCATTRPATLEDVERRHITEILDRTRWRISGKGGAAEILDMVPTTLHSRMKKLGIVRPR